MQQFLRTDCIEIIGIPTMPLDIPKQLVLDLGSLIDVSIDRFSNDCWKTKTKANTPTNDNRSRQRDEPTKIPSNYM